MRNKLEHQMNQQLNFLNVIIVEINLGYVEYNTYHFNKNLLQKDKLYIQNKLQFFIHFRLYSTSYN